MATILVIDDDQQMRRMVKAIFQRKTRHHVLDEETGADGVDKAILVAPDLILLDVRLPGLDGFEVCRRIKAHPKTHGIPVIMVTCLRGKEDVVNAYASGANDYIVKPFEPATLLDKVASHLPAGTGASATMTPPGGTEPTPRAAAPAPAAPRPAPAAAAAPASAPVVADGTKKSLRGQLAAKLKKRGDSL